MFKFVSNSLHFLVLLNNVIFASYAFILTQLMSICAGSWCGLRIPKCWTVPSPMITQLYDSLSILVGFFSVVLMKMRSRYIFVVFCFSHTIVYFRPSAVSSVFPIPIWWRVETCFQGSRYIISHGQTLYAVICFTNLLSTDMFMISPSC